MPDQETKAALQQQNLLFESVIRAIPDAVLIAGLDYRLLFCNAGFTQIFEYQGHEVLGKPLAPLFADEASFQKQLEDWQSWYAARQQIPLECLFRKKDETVFLGQATNACLTDPQGGILGYLTIVKDVSQREWLENRLRQNRKMEALGEMACSVAHDFNNILNVICGYGEMIQEDAQDGEQVLELAGHLMRAGKSGTALTRQLLAFSRHQRCNPRLLDLNQLIRDFKPILDSLVKKHIQLKLHLEPGAVIILADEHQIEQVLLNLCANARDALNGEGEIVLRTTKLQLGENQYPDVAAGTYIALVVQDEGEGIEQASFEHIFEPFFTTKKEGTGMGLATVYGIVKQAKGHIDVESYRGRGTTITIFFPAANPGSQLFLEDE